MKILIDNEAAPAQIAPARSFPEFCQHVMGHLLARNLSIGSCELDGVVITNLDEAERLFQNCETCRISTIPLATAFEATLTATCEDARNLEEDCQELVTQVLLGEPAEIAARWHSICDDIKALVGYIPRLSGLLTEKQLDDMADRELKELSKIMIELHGCFNRGDSLQISDTVELKLVPWLRQLRTFFDNCLTLAKTLNR
jgi:hypothetical protein